MLKELIKLANNLDAKGLRKEADYLDKIISNASEASETSKDSPPDSNILTIEELRDSLEKEFPSETSISGRDICDGPINVAIEIQKDYHGLPRVLVHECDRADDKYFDNRELIDKIFVKLYSLGLNKDLDKAVFRWGGQYRQFGKERWIEPEGVTHYFAPTLKYREDFNPKKDVDGLWIHVLNQSVPSSAEELKSFLGIKGEISVSSWDPNISKPYFFRHHTGGPTSGFAILLKGKASLCWDNDIWSIVDERTGLRAPTRSPKHVGSKHEECFLSPSKAEPVGIFIGPDADKEMAKNFVDSAEELGIPVHTMSLRTDPLSRDFDLPYEEWMDWEERAASLIKGLVKMANDLDKRGLRKEASCLDGIIRKAQSSLKKGR